MYNCSVSLVLYFFFVRFVHGRPFIDAVYFIRLPLFPLELVAESKMNMF
jgi:hypothetical protein